MGHDTGSATVRPRNQITHPPFESASNPSRTHAEAELAAFSASSKRLNVGKATLPPLGAESSWPHGLSSKAVSESSTDALPAMASCNSWVTNATASTMLRNNSPYPGQSRMLPSNASSSNLSAMLASHGRLKGRLSVTPTSWQALVALSNKAKQGQSGIKMDILEAHPSKGVEEDSPDAGHTDQEEHVLRCFLSPKVLRKRHQLPDKDVARLYRILHIYSLGFHQVVGEVTLHADHRQPLLLAVWRAFSQLWQDALQVSFADEVAQLILERDSLAAACATAQDAAADKQQQNRELQARLRSLVGGAISRMTRERACKDHIAGLERQLQLFKEKEAKLSCETQAQHAQQGLQQASALEAGKPDDTAAKKANPQELQQAEAAVEAKQILLRQAYKQATEAEAKCKQLQQKLHEAQDQSRALQRACLDSQRQAEAAVKELRAKRTAYELVHTDWLATQEELKAHRHVLSRLDAMSNNVKQMQRDQLAMQEQLRAAEDRSAAATGNLALQKQHGQQLLAACEPLLALAPKLTICRADWVQELTRHPLPLQTSSEGKAVPVLDKPTASLGIATAACSSSVNAHSSGRVQSGRVLAIRNTRAELWSAGLMQPLQRSSSEPIHTVMGLARQALLKGGTQHQAASYSASFAEEHASSAVSSVPGSAKSAAGTVDVQPDRNSQYQHTSSGSWAAGQTSCQRFSDMDTKLRLKSATNPNLMTLLQGLAVAVTAMKQQGDPHEQADLNG